MSGGSTGPFPSGGKKQSNCELLTINSVVTSPKPNVVSQLKTGDIVDIAVSPTSSYSVVVALFQGSELGSLMSGAESLLDCIEQGYLFQGKVTRIHNGRVDLHISAV